MASRQETADYLLDQLARAGQVAARKMFGEYALYLGGKLFALVCDDQLFVKPTAAGRALIGKPREAPPYPGAKPYFLIDGDQCEDAEWLVELVRATVKELPLPKPKKPKAKKAKQKATPAKKAPRAPKGKRRPKKRPGKHRQKTAGSGAEARDLNILATIALA
jgi:DNA transformation protein and related proteins